MITAETITDEQIRELRAMTAGMAIAPHVNALCDLALAEGESARTVLVLKPHKQRNARARCAEILNERAARSP